MKLLKLLHSFYFPHKCAFCQTMLKYDNERYICVSCMDSLPFIKTPRCLKCSAPIHQGAMPVCHNCRVIKVSFQKAFIPLLYQGLVRRSLLRLKFYDRTHLTTAYSHLIVEEIIKNGYPDFDFITYIPVSKERLAERSYNQSKLIAKKCAKLLNLPVYSTLHRVDKTPRQSSLPRNKRLKNAKASYKSRSVMLHGNALLIDDIYTTGSTLSVASSLLLKMGCEKVYVAALAMTPKN